MKNRRCINLETFKGSLFITLKHVLADAGGWYMLAVSVCFFY